MINMNSKSQLAVYFVLIDKLKKINFPITQKLTEVIEKFFLFVVWNPIPFYLSTFVQHLIIWNFVGHVSIFV